MVVSGNMPKMQTAKRPKKKVKKKKYSSKGKRY